MNEVAVLEKKITSSNLFLSKVAISWFSLMSVPGNFKPIPIQSGGQAPEREPSGLDLKGGTLQIFIQIYPFEINFIFSVFLFSLAPLIAGKG